MKTYSIRVELDLKAVSNDEAQRLTELVLKEIRMENLSIKKASVFNHTDKALVVENLR